jgi:hypothetical protein
MCEMCCTYCSICVTDVSCPKCSCCDADILMRVILTRRVWCLFRRHSLETCCHTSTELGSPQVLLDQDFHHKH